MKKYTPFFVSFFLTVVCLVCMAAVSSFYIVDDTTGEKLPFGTGGELHFENISGLPNQVTVFSPVFDTTSYDTHLADSTIHFPESSIDHTALQNIGTNSHAAIDSHMADSTMHFTEGSIDHTTIQNIGTNSHAAIDSHMADSTVHFTEGSIDHTAIQNIGTNSHAAIDTHISDGTIHAPIFDNLSTSTSTLWSSDYTKDYVDFQSGGSATIPTGVIWQFAGSSAPPGWLICDGDEISRTTYADLFSVVGETYGYGNYSTTFNLPDLRGRTAIGAGQGSGLSNRLLGDIGGEETHALTSDENGSHTHTIDVSTGTPNSWTGTRPMAGLGPGSSTSTSNSSGSGTAHNTMQPFLVMNYIIKY